MILDQSIGLLNIGERLSKLISLGKIYKLKREMKAIGYPEYVTILKGIYKGWYDLYDISRSAEVRVGLRYNELLEIYEEYDGKVLS